jgi:hypothetical protein
MKNFPKRNLQLAVRTTQVFTFARAKSFTPDVISRVFDIRDSAIEKITSLSIQITQLRQTAITVVQHKYTNVLGLKGMRRTAAELGAPVTTVTCESCVSLCSSVSDVPYRKREDIAHEQDTSFTKSWTPPNWIDTEGGATLQTSFFTLSQM